VLGLYRRTIGQVAYSARLSVIGLGRRPSTLDSGPAPRGLVKIKSAAREAVTGSSGERTRYIERDIIFHSQKSSRRVGFRERNCQTPRVSQATNRHSKPHPSHHATSLPCTRRKPLSERHFRLTAKHCIKRSSNPNTHSLHRPTCSVHARSKIHPTPHDASPPPCYHGYVPCSYRPYDRRRICLALQVRTTHRKPATNMSSSIQHIDTRLYTRRLSQGKKRECQQLQR
jgi:hypothetical protein